jgi:hypothetical protein
MTNKDKIEMLVVCLHKYLNGDMVPVEGYKNTFYSGVLWVYGILVSLFDETDNK